MTTETRQAVNRAYAAQWGEAARIACTTYLDGVAAFGDVRRAQEYDNLNDAGKAVWRAVAMRAAHAMPPEPEPCQRGVTGPCGMYAGHEGSCVVYVV